MYQLFKGYIPIKNKQGAMSFKGKTADELLNIREAKSHEEYAGVLNDNTILIDVDDHDKSEILMKIVEDKQLACRVYETKRGKHFYFKNNERVNHCKTGAMLACGLKADIKIGSVASYGVLKLEGNEREIIYDVYSDEDYDTVPKYLTPVRTKTDFLSMKAGDGRNQELFNYILTLQSSGLSKDEAIEAIETINQYVLSEKLDKKELKTILRDDSFKKPVFYDGKSFLHDKFGLFLISEYKIIKIAGILHYFKDGVYVPANIESLMIKHIPNLKQAQRKEVLAFLTAYIDKNTTVAPANFIAFKNGIYDVTTGTLEAPTGDKVLTNKINWNYNTKAYSEKVNQVLNDLACNDKQVRLLLEELIGYTFYRRNELRKSFLLKSTAPRAGKSTFIDMIRYLLGEDNISSLDLADLAHEYKAAGLFGTLANLGDDIEDEYIPSAGIFKKVVSGDRMNVNVKFEKPIEFNPYCKLIFSGNSIPRLGRGRDSSAIIDRLIIVPFNASFGKTEKKYDPFIKYDLHTTEAMEYLVKLGIEGLNRVLTINSFTTNDDINTAIEEYEETLNPIKTFFEEMGDSMANEPTKKCYREYDRFCYENAMKPVTHIEFSRQVKDFYHYDIKNKRVNGKVVKVFVKGGTEDDRSGD